MSMNYKRMSSRLPLCKANFRLRCSSKDGLQVQNRQSKAITCSTLVSSAKYTSRYLSSQGNRPLQVLRASSTDTTHKQKYLVYALTLLGSVASAARDSWMQLWTNGALHPTVQARAKHQLRARTHQQFFIDPSSSKGYSWKSSAVVLWHILVTVNRGSTIMHMHVRYTPRVNWI